jgi:DNA-binding MarR family transcriptional regulator
MPSLATAWRQDRRRNENMTERKDLVDFMIRLRKIDKRHLTQRDFLLLWCIRENPGIEGIGITAKFGFKSRSMIQTNLARLEREGYIEDRRKTHSRTVPCIFHLTPKGEELWKDIIDG